MMQLVEDEPRLDPGVIDPQNLPLCQELGDEIEGTWKGQVWMPKNCKFKMFFFSNLLIIFSFCYSFLM